MSARDVYCYFQIVSVNFVVVVAAVVVVVAVVVAAVGC